MFKWIAFSLVFALTAQAARADKAPQLPNPLVVANSASWVPYSFLDQQGQPRGILVELWQLFAEANNIDVEFKLVDWADSIELVRRGAAHLHGGLIETQARSEVLHFFPTKIFRIRSVVFMHEDIEVGDLAVLTGVPVGVVTASTEEEFLRANFSYLSLKAYPNSQRLVEAAVAGDIQVFVSDYPTGYYHMITLQRLDHFVTGPTLFTRPIFAATLPGDDALLARIDSGTKKLSRSEIERVYRRWFIPKQPLPGWVVPAAAATVMLMLLTAVGVHSLTLRRTIKSKTAALQASVQELEAANARLDRLARTDYLTSLPNRLAFFQLASREMNRTTRYGRSLSLAVLDLDHFKAVNDRYGHDAGDTALKHLTKIMGAQIRPSDVFARIGGEEFALLMPETEPQEAKRLLERILKTVKGTPAQHQDIRIALSFSAGVTGYYEGATVDKLINHADIALYKSKEQGRSSVSLNLFNACGTCGNQIMLTQ